MTTAFEFIVTLRDSMYVSSLATSDGSSVDETPIDDDPLRDSTITVLQDWLDRWGTLSGHNEGLEVEDTFKVVGTYLYRLAFPGEIDAHFRTVYAAARRAAQKLRVSLRFVGRLDRFAAYPWEFLYFPQEGFMGLESDTDLVLSRDIGVARTDVQRHGPPLRVTFVVALPECPDFKNERKTLIYASLRFRLPERRVWPDTVESWDLRAGKKQVDDHKPHVLHVFGVCRGTGRDVEIGLGYDEERERVRWSTSAAFVDDVKTLVSGPAARDALQLIVLHLCQASHVDYAATFGSVARDLVEAGFPAVLAMQYPLPVKAGTTDFPTTFYTLLAAGLGLGAAVQTARIKLREIGRHLFGAPVLYLQSNDGVVIAEPPGPGRSDADDVGEEPHATSTSGAGADVGAARGGGPKESPIEVLNKVVDALDDAAVAAELRRWIDATLADRTASGIASAISKRAQAEDVAQLRGALYDMLAALAKAGFG